MYIYVGMDIYSCAPGRGARTRTGWDPRRDPGRTRAGARAGTQASGVGPGPVGWDPGSTCVGILSS